MLSALACGVCEYLLIDYSAPGLARYMLVLCVLFALGATLSIASARIKLLAIIGYIALVSAAAVFAFMVYGAATFTGAVVGFLAVCVFLSLKVASKRRSVVALKAIWAVVAIGAMGAIPYCIAVNRAELARQPERMVHAVVEGQITARKAEKELQGMPDSAMRQLLAKQLRDALVIPPARITQRVSKERIVAVLVTWHDHAALNYILEAKKMGFLRAEVADPAISKLQEKPGA